MAEIVNVLQIPTFIPIFPNLPHSSCQWTLRSGMWDIVLLPLLVTYLGNHRRGFLKIEKQTGSWKSAWRRCVLEKNPTCAGSCELEYALLIKATTLRDVFIITA